MTTEIERLVVSLEANVEAYERELARAGPLAERAMAEAERAVEAGGGRIAAAMARAGAEVRDELARMAAPETLGRLQRAVEQASALPMAADGASLRRVDDAVGSLTARLTEAGSASREAVAGFEAVAGAVGSIADKIPATADLVADLGRRVRAASGEDAAIRARITDAFAISDAAPRGSLAQIAMSAPGGTATPEPARAPARSPAQPVKAAEPEDDAFRDEVARLTRRTNLLQVEAGAVGREEGAAAKAEAAFRLLEAAKKADLAVTPALREEVDRVAEAYGAATAQVERAEAAQRAAQSASRELGSALADSFKGAILHGERLTTVVARLATTLASRGLDRAFDGLFGRGSPGSDLIGDALGSLGLTRNPTGRAAGGPVTPGVAYTVGESGRETFVPLQPGRILPATHGVTTPAPAPTVQVSVSIATADAPSFHRSEAQVSAALARAVQRGLRGL
ncbi:hypothetical protein [Methylobacterium frigidaeris]|uniref:Phage tail tape measure protein n=1 Tax=Methylobacterium frigidaeris TaxID=2038277 RepID=A0AA37M5Z0_9HYPH|nr:hypothetical protein [Methylobacterium frigidaeris]PIK72897.1 hypothetical protein CS379_11435 [Methylobacterium frigidaeris]GJD63326.1 hypothetical protein MPEAHAMD_3492 [Methylobacterium frigidaeris]